MPTIVPRAVGIPIRRPQSDKRRHQIHSSRVGFTGSQGFDFRRGANQPQPVAKPLHDRAGNEYRTFQAIHHLPVQSPADGRQQIVVRGHRLVARVEQQKAAGTVGILGRTRLEAGLAERGRLLIATTGSNGNRRTSRSAVVSP